LFGKREGEPLLSNGSIIRYYTVAIHLLSALRMPERPEILLTKNSQTED